MKYGHNETEKKNWEKEQYEMKCRSTHLKNLNINRFSADALLCDV